MTFDELYKKVIDAQRAFEERKVPISLDFKIEDLRDALVESNDTIEKLKQKLDNAQASAYAESVDAGMENRRLKRALWLARAARARSMKTYEELDNYTRNHLNRNSRWDYISSQRYDCWFYAWDNCEQKCLKKANEYK
jgi:predicted RNase H-like nuclease (RuvC/YqgF family)